MRKFANLSSKLCEKKNRWFASMLHFETSENDTISKSFETANALIKKEFSFKISQNLIKNLSSLLAKNIHAKKVREKLSELAIWMIKKKLDLWTNKNDFLRKNNILYTLKNKVLQLNLIKRYHNVSLIDHFALARMLNFLQRKYYWLNMKKLMKKFCNACEIC